MSYDFPRVLIVLLLSSFVGQFWHDVSSKTEIRVFQHSLRVDENVFALDVSVNNLFRVHECHSLHDLLENELNVRFCEVDVLLPQQFVQIKLDELKDEVDGLILASDDVDKFDYVFVVSQLLEDLYFSD